MPIVRGHHAFEAHFTQIPNAWLRDTRLSYKARGLLAELMTHSVGFQVSRERLARNGQDGDRAVRSAIAELESAGYLKRSQGRSDDQKFAAAIWTTCDPFEPSVRFAPAGNAPADNATPKKKEEKKTEVEKKTLAQEGLGRPDLDQAFEDFWIIYPRKVEKLAAKRAFVKAWSSFGQVVTDGAKRMAADPNLPPKQFIPHPATWLNGGGWDSEPYPEREKSKEEIEVLRLEQSRRRREADLREQEERRKERERIEEELRLNPVQRCEHNRVIHVCPVCSRLEKPSA